MIQTLIRWAKVVQAAASGKTYPEQLTTAFGKPPTKSITVYPFGFFANASADTIGPELLIGGDSSQPFIIPMSVEGRPELEEGEVAVFHPGSGSVITMKANGDIEVESTADVNVTCVNAAITASEDASIVSLTATVNASTSLALISALTTVTGPVTINGVLTLNGNYVSTGTMLNNGVNVGSTHIHAGFGGFTDVPQ